jgi:hypothetical protein
MPNAVLFGYLIEWSETLGGPRLMIAGLLALLRPLVERSLRGRSTTIFAYSFQLV